MVIDLVELFVAVLVKPVDEIATVVATTGSVSLAHFADAVADRLH